MATDRPAWAVDLPPGSATGLGSWPGDELAEVPEAARFVRDTLVDLPHLLELPGRGPGADLIGRGAALLVDLPVELQPHGWRLVERPGRDLRRARSFLRADLDVLAETFDGYAGPLKVQLTGPWTLASSLWLPRGERALTDPGAQREIIDSIAEGARVHVASVRAAVPGAQIVVQIDEPGLPAVLDGRLPTASGYGRVRAVDGVAAEQGLVAVVDAVRSIVGGVVLHCCAGDAPIGVLIGSGAQALSLDLALLSSAGWEQLAEATEDGLRLWAGVVPTTPIAGSEVGVVDLIASIVRPWRAVGLELAGLREVVVTPTCGLAGLSPAQARAAVQRAVAVGRALGETAEEG